MGALDTKVLIRFPTQDDPGQARTAEAHLQGHAPLWISLPVLVGTHHVLARLYGWKKDALLAMLQAIAHSHDFTLQDRMAVVDATAAWAACKAGFVDCLNVAWAKAHGHSPLATFDRELGHLPGTLPL